MAPSQTNLFLVAYLLFIFPIITTQQYGNFFTAIYVGSDAYGQGQVSCASIGSSSYCCASGQYCAVDAASQVACCASGQTCQGVANNGEYSSSYQSTTTYSTTCGCESDPKYAQTVTTQNSVVPVVYGALVTITTTVGYQQSTTTITAYSTPSTTFTTEGFIVTTTTPTLTTATPAGFIVITTSPTLTTATPEGIVTTQVNNPGTCGSFSTIIAQGNNLPATKNCIIFISQAPRTRGADLIVISGLLTIGIWSAFVICL